MCPGHQGSRGQNCIEDAVCFLSCPLYSTYTPTYTPSQGEQVLVLAYFLFFVLFQPQYALFTHNGSTTAVLPDPHDPSPMGFLPYSELEGKKIAWKTGWHLNVIIDM